MSDNNIKGINYTIQDDMMLMNSNNVATKAQFVFEFIKGNSFYVKNIFGSSAAGKNWFLSDTKIKYDYDYD